MASHERGRAEEAYETSFGERFVFRDTAEDTDGELLRTDLYVDHEARRPLHNHPEQDERFVVHEGTLGLAIDDEELLLEPGDEEHVSAGTNHTYWRAGEETVHVTTEHRPALRFEEFLEVMVRIDEANGLDDDGMPGNPFVGAAVLAEFRDEIRPADVPEPVQRVVFPAMAKLGSLVGYGVPDPSSAEPGRTDA